MELFNANGHPTDQALRILAEGGALTELERLELAEHLSYCDECLLRYTEQLPPEIWEAPSLGCREGIWRKIRRRTFTVLSSRYATAAAALVIVVALWAFGVFGGTVQLTRQLGQVQRPAAQERWESWPERWRAAMTEHFSNFQQIFDFFGGETPSRTIQGGMKS